MKADRAFVVGDVVSLPSGPKRNAGKPHDHLLVARDGTDVLLVPICTLRESLKHEIVLTSDDLDWLLRPSYPELVRARITPQANLRSLIDHSRPRTTANPTGLLEATAQSRKVAETIIRHMSDAIGFRSRFARFLKGSP